MDDGMNTQTYEQNFWLRWLRLHSGTFIFSCQLFGYKHLVFVWLFNSPSVLWFHGVSVPPAMIWLLATINLRSLSLQTKARSKNNWAGPVEQQSSSNWIIMIQNDTTPPDFEAFQSLPFECHSCTSDTDPTDPIRYRCLGLSKLILVSKWESFEVPWRAGESWEHQVCLITEQIRPKKTGIGGMFSGELKKTEDGKTWRSWRG